MQGRLAFCIRASVLSLALFACSTGEPTSPENPEDPEVPPIPSTVRWSEASSWPGGQVPGAGAAVAIPSGKAVLLDVSPPKLGSLRVEGALVFDEQDLDLTAGHILVLGTFRVGTSAVPFQHRATITLTGTLADGEVMGMGNRVLGVAGGTLDLHGESRTGWTRLSSTASAGSSQLLLEGAPDWRAGDKLVVASTDFDPNHAEVVTISSVSGPAVTLAEALDFSHYGELQTIAGHLVDERAEVGLLTRNVLVRGDSSTSQEAGYGGHIMGTGGTLRVSGVMLRFMGQKGLMARYPMHWHVMGPVDGQYFTGSSVWGSFNRCVTVHGTDNARVEGNVCHSHLGHGYFL
jgi:cell surface hyaluronidase